MDRRRWWLGLLAGLLLPARAGAWEIARFETDVAIHDDATATVTETILADFAGESRHGIYRDIPVHYADRAGQHFVLRLRVRSVTDGAGRTWSYRLESAGRARRVRVGDPNATVTGRQTYRIVYDVQRGAIRFFPDHDECYWNLTGNEWAVPMREVRAQVRLPAAPRQLRAEAYQGGYGSTARLNGLQVLADRVVLEPVQAFGPYEGLTAAVAWEPGIVHPPSAWQVVLWWLEDNWVYGLPLLVLVGMTWLWAARGRDPRLGRSQVVQYAPPDGLTPAEVGTLVDERAHLRDITATVVDLAVRGYLRIEPLQASWFSGRDYRLVPLKPWNEDVALKPHERHVLIGIFGATSSPTQFSDLKDVFYVWLPKIRERLYDGLIKAGYLDSHPETVRTFYVVSGCVLGGGMWGGLWATEPWHQVPPVATAMAALVSGLVVIAFSRIMPRRTRKGAETTNKIMGFLEFLRRTDEERIRRMNDPALFERCLPYALAFGVAARWARVFDGIYTQPPSWYTGTWDQFSAYRLGRDLDQATASMGQTFASQPRASGGSSGSWGGSGGGGGGFSGGGGGGGGGGAW